MRAKLTNGTSETVLKHQVRDYLIYLHGTYGLERSDFNRTVIDSKYVKITYTADRALIDKTTQVSESLTPAPKW